MGSCVENMFTALKNGQKTNRNFILICKNKKCEQFLKILWNEGFILGYALKNNKIQIFLKYLNNKPTINSLNTISKPSKRIFYSKKQIWKINSNKYFIIFSTNKGLKTITDCKKLNLGGEPILLIN